MGVSPQYMNTNGSEIDLRSILYAWYVRVRRNLKNKKKTPFFLGAAKDTNKNPLLFFFSHFFRDHNLAASDGIVNHPDHVWLWVRSYISTGNWNDPWTNQQPFGEIRVFIRATATISSCRRVT